MEIFQQVTTMILQHPLLLRTCFFSTLVLTQLMTSPPAASASAAAAETVKVSTTPIFPEIPLGQARKDFQVLLRVEAPARPEARVPIDVVAVLDVSGSTNDPPERRMTTTASRLDLLKTAVKFMVSKLNDGDRLAVVMEDSSSGGLLYMTADGRRKATRIVDQLQARGGTALVPAFEEAVKVLDARVAGADGRNRLGFIVVLTDGGAGEEYTTTLSERRREAIRLRGALGRYPVHTFGLGAAHDAEVLLYLAQESQGGTYSFVDDDGDIAGALAVCLGGLTTVAAVDTRVVLKAAADGVRVGRVDSGSGDHDSSVSCGGTGNSCEVSVGVLYAGEAKHFVVHLHVSAAAETSTEAAGSYYCNGDSHRRHDHQQHHLLAAVGYSYRTHPSAAAAVTVEGHGVFVQRSPPAAQAPVVSSSPSTVVLQHIVRFELLELVTSVVVVKHHDGGNRADVLQLRWEEFRACHQFWGGGGIDLMLSGLEKEVDGMVRSLRAGVAAHVYAWVSSHQTQRAASVGSPEKAADEFLTPAMRILLDEARKLPRWPTTTHVPGTGSGTRTAAAATNGQHAAGCVVVVDGLEMVERRLELWSKLKRDVQQLMSFQEKTAAVDEDEEQHLAAVFQEASLEAIDRAMHRDIYLAAVYASKQRRCHSGANEC